MLTRRQREILTLMRDGRGDDAELVYERGRGCVGVERVSGRTVFALLRAAAISADGFSGGPGDFERYTINETGRGLLEEGEK